METNRSDEIAASVAAWQALGPGYDEALAEGLVERISAEIDNRIAAQVDDRLAAEVDSRIVTQLDRYAGCRHLRRRARRALRAERAARADRSRWPPVLLALGSMVTALLVTLVVLKNGTGLGSAFLAVVIWIIIAVVNLAYADKSRRQ